MAGAGALFAVGTITASLSFRLQPMQIAITRQSLKRHNLPPIVRIPPPPYTPAALPLLPLLGDRDLWPLMSVSEGFQRRVGVADKLTDNRTTC